MKRDHDTLAKIISEKSNDFTILQKKYKQVTGNSLFLDPYAAPLKSPLPEPPTVSVIIPSWNSKGSLLACLLSIEKNSFNLCYPGMLEVIVCDDGSTDNTWKFLTKRSFSMKVTLIRQHHCGVASARNTAIAAAGGEVFVFCDADILLSFRTLEHLVFRQKLLPNTLLIGFRSEINETNIKTDPGYIGLKNGFRGTHFAGDVRIKYPVEGHPGNMCLASGHLKKLGKGRGLWMPDGDTHLWWLLPDLVFGALFSVSREIYYNAGGYHEGFTGWGCEDGHFAAKVIAGQNYIIPIYAASGIHISHNPRSEDQGKEYAKNRKLFFHLLNTPKTVQVQSWEAQAKRRIVDSLTLKLRKGAVVDTAGSNNDEEDDIVGKTESLLALGRYSKAYELMKENPKEFRGKDYFLKTGEVFIGLKKYQEAIKILEEGYRLSNFKDKMVVKLVEAKAAIGHFETAHKLLKSLLINSRGVNFSYWYSSNLETRIKQGNYYFNQGFYDVALRCFEAALVIDPGNQESLKYRKRSLLHAK